MNALSSIISDGRQSVQTLRKSLTTQLDAYENYRKFRTAKNNLQKEIEIRDNTLKLVSTLSTDGAKTVVAEIDSQMRLLKDALFNGPRIGKSPVRAWLDFQVREYKGRLTEFENDLASVLTYINKTIAPSGRIDNFAQLMAQKANVQSFDLISAKAAPPGSTANKAICQHLTQLTLAWDNAETHLSSAKFFCDSIKSMISTNPETSGIRQLCYGDVNPINGMIYRKSDLQSLEEQRNQILGSKHDSVAKKYKELSCDERDIVEAAQ
jgi:hypothetical protein